MILRIYSQDFWFFGFFGEKMKNGLKKQSKKQKTIAIWSISMPGSRQSTDRSIVEGPLKFQNGLSLDKFADFKKETGFFALFLFRRALRQNRNYFICAEIVICGIAFWKLVIFHDVFALSCFY